MSRYQPSIIAFDVETTGLYYWQEDFRVLSAAFAWRGAGGEMRTRYTEGEDETWSTLARIAEDGIPLLVHNLAFEYGVTKHRFADLAPKLDLAVDTMRLIQVADNGGQEDYAGEVSLEDELAAMEGFKRRRTGLSLESGVRRHLPDDLHNHKEPFYRTLRDLGVRRGHEGANLDRLPKDMFIEYNLLDAVRTLQLYEALTAEFAAGGYDWSFDHRMYVFMAKKISDARGTGVKVDVERAKAYVQALQAEIDQIDATFRERFLPHISKIEQAKRDAYINGPKTDRGRAKRRERLEAREIEFPFNVGSTKQLQELFCGKLGMEPKFLTPKGNPSFASQFCSQWGEGGELLGARKQRLFVLKQTEALLENAEQNQGRWAIDLRPCGTKTGRFASTGGAA